MLLNNLDTLRNDTLKKHQELSFLLLCVFNKITIAVQECKTKEDAENIIHPSNEMVFFSDDKKIKMFNKHIVTINNLIREETRSIFDSRLFNTSIRTVLLKDPLALYEDTKIKVIDEIVNSARLYILDEVCLTELDD